MTLYLVTIVKLILGDLGAVSRVERKGATKEVSEDELNSSPIGELGNWSLKGWTGA